MPDTTTSTSGPIPAPTSPTGTPWIPAPAMKYVALAILLALAILGVLMGCYPQVHAFAVAFAVTSAVAGVLGIASPGLRTPTIGLLLACCVTLNACHPTPAQKQQAVDCAQQMGSGVITHAAEILRAAADQDWFAALDSLLVSVGPGALCEGAALLAMMQSNSPTPDIKPLITAGCVASTVCPLQDKQALRIEAWLRGHAADYR